MRIAFISTLHGSDHGGSEELWMKLAIHAQNNGHLVEALVYKKKKLHPSLRNVLDAGVTVKFRETQTVPTHLHKKITKVFSRKILGYNPYSVLNRFKPDVIYINQAGSVDVYNDQYLREYLERKNFPFIINPHQVSENCMMVDHEALPKVQNLFNKASRVIFVSRRNKDVLFKKWSITNPNTYITVNPLNLQSTDSISFPPLDEGLQFATVAALNCSQKGQDLMLKVLAKDKWKARNWVWNLYGEGPDEEKLAFMTRELGLSDRVFFKGYKSNIRSIWKENHLHLFPTLSEGMPMSIIESLFCGRPVVATDIGGITEWVADNVNGCIAKKPTIESLDFALEMAWNKFQQSAFSPQAINEKVLEQYNFNFLEDLLVQVTAVKNSCKMIAARKAIVE